METRVSRNRHRYTKKPIYKKWGFWLIILLLFVVIKVALGMGNSNAVYLDVDQQTATLKDDADTTIGFETNKGNKYTLTDLSTNHRILHKTASNGSELITFKKAGKYKLTVSNEDNHKSKIIKIKPKKMSTSDLLASLYTSDDADSDDTHENSDSSSSAESNQVPADYKAALNKAKDYSDTMQMSKQGIYEQLTSEYGEKFSAPAAQYAIDNLKADYNANALAKAKSYQEDQDMSPEGIRDQLTSEYGEQFTPDEANYAIQHLND